METMITQELLLPFELEAFHWSAYWVINITLAAFCSIGIATTGLRNHSQLARPAFMVAVLAHLIFQWPLAIFSPIFDRSLPEFWFLAVAFHIPILVFLAWVTTTANFVEYIRKPNETPELRFQNISPGSQLILLILFAVLVIVYLSKVGWQCTGLYAMIFDPELALLARETSGKLVHDRVASYGFGVLANVVCPLVIYTVLCHAIAMLTKRQILKTLAWSTLGISALLVVLFPGAKGGLVPTAIVVGIGFAATRGTWKSRIAIITCVFGSGFLMLSMIEVLRERQVIASGCYDFGACVWRHNACPEASTLLQSLRYRDMSLGLSTETISKIENDRDAACSREQQSYESSRCSSRQIIKKAGAIPIQKPSGPGSKSSVAGEKGPGKGDVASRMGQYAVGIAYRLGVVPLQVAGWHHLYVAEHGSPGVRALPFSSFLFGQRIVMPIRVHEAYYHLYSGGDRTSTGTAPTSFILAYPAYLGFIGIVLSLIALLAFDLIVCRVFRRLRSSLRRAGIGLMAVGSANFMASDFGTTLLTHGTAAAIFLLLMLSFTEKEPEVL
jgi:hypothetical protein